jgi:hypothetical protein
MVPGRACPNRPAEYVQSPTCIRRASFFHHPLPKGRSFLRGSQEFGLRRCLLNASFDQLDAVDTIPRAELLFRSPSDEDQSVIRQ